MTLSITDVTWPMSVASGFPKMVFMGFSATRYTGTAGRLWAELLQRPLVVDPVPLDLVDSSFYYRPALSIFLRSLGQCVQVILFNMGQHK